jgi:thymidylate synthase
VERVISNLQNDYVDLARLLVTAGNDVTVRGIPTRELTGVTLVCHDGLAQMLPTGVNRKINTKLAAVEALGMIGGVWPHELVQAASPAYNSVLVDASPEAAAYAAYGPRIHARDQFTDLVAMLRDDPTSRQAILPIWRGEDLTHQGDRPCTLVLQFLLRDNKLELHVTMRSQDVWLGLGIDAFVFTQVQHTVARMLHVKTGKYVHHVGSLHAYQRDWLKILELTKRDGNDDVGYPLGVADPLTARLLLDGAQGSEFARYDWYRTRISDVRKSVRRD